MKAGVALSAASFWGVSVRTNSDRSLRSALGKLMGGMALPGTTRDGFLKCGIIHATVRCSFGIFVKSGPMPCSPAPAWQPLQPSDSKKAKPANSLGVKACQATVVGVAVAAAEAE